MRYESDGQTPDLDYNHYYTPNGREDSFILTDGTRHSFDEFAVSNGVDSQAQEKYGKDVHSQFHPLPSGEEIEKWIRNKLHLNEYSCLFMNMYALRKRICNKESYSPNRFMRAWRI